MDYDRIHLNNIIIEYTWFVKTMKPIGDGECRTEGLLPDLHFPLANITSAKNLATQNE